MKLHRFAALLALALAGRLWQIRGERRLSQNLPPPGELAMLSGGRLHWMSSGQGSPTVVLSHGLGGTLLDWDRVVPEVAQHTRVVRFDHAGLGWSDPRKGPRLPDRGCAELEQLLLAGGVPGPYLLVGWSSSTFDVRLFAGRHPDKVAGVVLVDPWHEDQLAVYPRLRSVLTGCSQVLRGLGWLAPFGVARLLGPGYRRVPFTLKRVLTQSFFNRRVQRQITATYRRAHTTRTLAAEMAGFRDSFAQMGRLRDIHPFPPVPLAVVTHGFPDQPGSPLSRMITAMHPELARLSPLGRQIFAPGSGHLVPFDRPDVIAAAILDVLTRVRKGGPAYPK